MAEAAFKQPQDRRADIHASGMEQHTEASAASPVAQLLDASPRVRSLRALGESLNAAPIQRVVKEKRNPPEKGKPWYSTIDRGGKNNGPIYYATQDLAEARETKLSEEREEEKKAIEQERQKERDALYEEQIKAFKDFKPEKSEEARVYKAEGHDDMPIFNLNPETAKPHAEKMFVERRAKKFESAVIKMHQHHYVVAPGTDIGLTGLKPESGMIGKSDGKVPLRRKGKAEKYASLGPPLDVIAERLSRETLDPIKFVRKRMGRDLDRLSRASGVFKGKGALPYTEGDLTKMQEVAAIIRLDKGRVPKATSYIRKSFTSGASFTDLLVKNAYVGAPSGGVKALRGEAKDGGEESDGTDLEEMAIEKEKKRKPISKAHSLPLALDNEDLFADINAKRPLDGKKFELPTKKKVKADTDPDPDPRTPPQDPNDVIDSD